VKLRIFPEIPFPVFYSKAERRAGASQFPNSSTTTDFACHANSGFAKLKKKEKKKRLKNVLTLSSLTDVTKQSLFWFIIGRRIANSSYEPEPVRQ